MSLIRECSYEEFRDVTKNFNGTMIDYDEFYVSDVYEGFGVALSKDRKLIEVKNLPEIMTAEEESHIASKLRIDVKHINTMCKDDVEKSYKALSRGSTTSIIITVIVLIIIGAYLAMY